MKRMQKLIKIKTKILNFASKYIEEEYSLKVRQIKDVKKDKTHKIKKKKEREKLVETDHLTPVTGESEGEQVLSIINI